jgi:ribosome-associated translation inhibitor RaiA
MKIHTEGFSLTHAIRSYTETCAWDAFSNLGGKIRLEAFLRKEGHDAFSCTLKAKVWRKDFVVKEFGPDLYTLINDAHKGLCRNIHKVKEKRKAIVHRRAKAIKRFFTSVDDFAADAS